MVTVWFLAISMAMALPTIPAPNTIILLIVENYLIKYNDY